MGDNASSGKRQPASSTSSSNSISGGSKATKGEKFNPYKRSKRCMLESGMDGFLISATNGRDENKCIKDCYSLLNEVVEENDRGSSDAEEGVVEGSTLSIEEQIELELKDMKNKQKERVFNKAGTGCRGLSFIVYKPSKEGGLSVSELASAVFEKALSTPGGISRQVQRLLPIQKTVPAKLEAIVSTIKTLVESSKLASDQPSTTFKIHLKRRFHDGLERDEVIEAIAQALNDVCPHHKADLNNPDIVVVVEIIKGIACLSVVDNFVKYHRYNLHETQKDCKE
eukprot:m.32347 g.32347  ORF g.32347 m.32347 type:complete len:283 (+) comp6378_c2_seq1:123-971(+)